MFRDTFATLRDVVHRPQHSDARMQQRTATFRSQDQGLYGGLPVR
jgi:hypothetical protein